MPLPKDAFKRFRSKINQYEATTGRQLSPQAMESIFAAELRVQAERGTVIERQNLEKARFAEASTLERERLKREKGAAKVGGITSIAQLGLSGAEVYGKLRPKVPTGVIPETSVRPTIGRPGAGITTDISAAGGGGAVAAGGAGISPALTGIATTEGLHAGVGAAGGLTPTAGGIGLPVSTATLPSTAAGFDPSAALPGTASGAAPGLLSTLGAGAGVAGVAGLGSAAGGMVFGGEGGVVGSGRDTQRAGQVGGGVAAGAAAGSVVPVIGTTIGAAIGGVVGALGALPDEEGDKVICTELNRRGYISDEVLDLDVRHRKQFIHDTVQSGYLKWANPLVGLMKKSWIITQIVRPFGCAWANEMASRMSIRYKGNLLGKAIIKVGLPLCGFIGRRVK